MSLKSGKRVVALLAVAVLAACADSNVPSGPNDIGPFGQASVANLPPQAQRAQWFKNVAPEVLELDQTVFADDDEATGQLVFGVEHAGVGNRVRGVLARYGIPASAYRIEEVEPIVNMATLRDVFRPTVGGIQIHFGQYLCTLGFNVTAGSQRSFITNSHCTNVQGGVEGTTYYQPVSSASAVIATEVADPAYSSIPGCASGKACRKSDASRALYASGTESTQGRIAKTTGVNDGSVTTAGEFAITQQSGSPTFSGTVHKIGRTTGWTSGNVAQTCATVNLSGSNIQLLCQTIVQGKRGKKIVDGGDSGSPVFRTMNTTDVELLGILWGGSFSGDVFVFSPVVNILAELGNFDATGSSLGGGDGGGDDPTPCVPRGPNGNNCK
jgi:hypothetical protein